METTVSVSKVRKKGGYVSLVTTLIKRTLYELRFFVILSGYEHLQGVFLFPNGYKKQKQSKKTSKPLFERLFRKELWYITYKRNWDFINSEIQVCNTKLFMSVITKVSYRSSFFLCRRRKLLFIQGFVVIFSSYLYIWCDNCINNSYNSIKCNTIVRVLFLANTLQAVLFTWMVIECEW